MSEFLNTDRITISHLNPIISWKGKTFNQVTSILKKNPGHVIGSITTKSNTTNSIFLPNPLRIPRREIATPITNTSCSRVSYSIDELNRPNGSIINSSSTITNGLVNKIESNLPNNTCEKPNCSPFLSVSENAKRRCRSSGNIKKSFNPANNSQNYCVDTTQYLNSRSKSFSQNSFNFLRVGNSQLTPGFGTTVSNIYSSNSALPYCPKFKIASNCTFNYQWLDMNYYTVTVPSGYYSIDDINGLFINTMITNYHFLVKNETSAKVFLLNINYNDLTRTVELQCSCYDTSFFSNAEYSADIHSSWSGTSIYPPANGEGSSIVPGFQFNDDDLFKALGFASESFPANYPPVPISYTGQVYSTPQLFTSIIEPSLTHIYNRVYYKPNNPQFAQQGAVSASSLIARLKYNTINTVAAATTANTFNTQATGYYGGNISNALAYGVSESPYTIKNKIGYPLPSYPKFLPNTTEQRNCVDVSTRGV